MTELQPAIPFQLQIELVGDWHIGEGTGQQGYIDRLVRRHPLDQLPYLPAKTIIGIWRDACEAVADGLGGSWPGWVNVVFGDQPALRRPVDAGEPIRAASLSVREARFPEALAAHLALPNNRPLRQAVTYIKPGVKIDQGTGQALDDHLRFDEVVRSGLVLEASATLEGLDEGGSRAALALLWAGAKTIERLGGKRRRGLGRCLFKLCKLPVPENELLRTLNGDPPPPNSGPGQDEQLSPAIPCDTESSWVTVSFNVELLQPVIVPDQVAGNVIRSLDFFPGTYFLNHITRVLRSLTKRDWLPAVARGDLLVTNAFPIVDGHRGLPVPLALFHDKEQGGLDKGKLVWNRLVDGDEEDWQLKQHRSGYVGRFDKGGTELPAFVKSSEMLQETTHNTVADGPQRPTEEVGGVYTYQAIRAGTVLRSELRLRSWLAKELPPHWREKLAGDVRLGVAKKDDYGRARIKPESVGPRTITFDLTDRGSLQTSGEADATDESFGTDGQPNQLTVWLISDLLLRNDHLQLGPTLEQLAIELHQRLGLGQTSRLEPCARRSGRHGTLSALLRTRRTEGWNAGWGLPQPSRVACMAGSCVVFDIHGLAPPLNVLRLVETEGLGERRAEGYGEIKLDHPLLTNRLRTLERPSVQDSNPGTSGSRSAPSVAPLGRDDAFYSYARLLEEAAWIDAIRRTGAALGADKDWRRKRFGWTEKKPTNSQLGALRANAGQVRDFDNKTPLTDWIDRMEKSDTQQDKWPRRSLKTLKKLTDQVQIVWGWLAEPAGQSSDLATVTENAEDELKHALWATVIRSLLFACIRGEIRDREWPGRTNHGSLPDLRSTDG